MDPLTLIATATGAFNFLKAGMEKGKEIEKMVSQLGTWFEAVAKFRVHQAAAANPPTFKKLLFSGSVEQEALQMVVYKKKLEEQERELMSLIVLRYGSDTFQEMIQMRRQIKSSRELLVTRRKQAISKLKTDLMYFVAILLLLGGLGFLVNWFIAYISTR